MTERLILSDAKGYVDFGWYIGTCYYLIYLSIYLSYTYVIRTMYHLLYQCTTWRWFKRPLRRSDC